MRTNLDSISEKIGKLGVEALAKQSGFIRSKPQKIHPADFVLSFMYCIGQVNISLTDWANQLMKLTQISVSKQAIDQRTAGPRHVNFAKLLLQACLSKQLPATSIQEEQGQLLGSFNRVLVQDSSCVKLPRILAHLFQGPHSKTGRPTATARIQYTTDLKKDDAVHFDLKGYRDNDQSYCSAIIQLLQKNDLVLRDLGYFVLEGLEKIKQAGAFFLSRLKPNVKVYLPGSTQALDLLKLCRTKARQGIYSFELIVEVGQKQRLPVRLIVEQLPQQIYEQRKRKAGKDRHQRTKHKKEYFDFLRWQLLITNAPAEQLPRQNAPKIYRLRWRIEIFFKCWKSQFHLQRVLVAEQQIKASRAQIMIYFYLAYFTLMCMGPFMHMARSIYRKTGKLLSLSKWARLIATQAIDKQPILSEKWIDHLARIATYERRSKRKNHLDLMWEHHFA